MFGSKAPRFRSWYDASLRCLGFVGGNHLDNTGRAASAIETFDLGSRENLLRPVWQDGELLVDWSLDEIRDRATAASQPR